jgi:hypothetical protein
MIDGHAYGATYSLCCPKPWNWGLIIVKCKQKYSKSAMSKICYILKWTSNPPKRCWLQLKYYLWKGRMIVIFIFYSNEFLLTRNDPKQIIWLIYQLNVFEVFS